MPPSRQRGEASTPVWTSILATSVISASSALLLHSYLKNFTRLDHDCQKDDRADDVAIQKTSQSERIQATAGSSRVPTFKSYLLTRLSLGGGFSDNPLRASVVSKDLPLWLGAGYLILHPRRSTIQSQERFADKLLDFLVIGLLLTFRAGEDDSRRRGVYPNTDDKNTNQLPLGPQSSNPNAALVTDSLPQQHDFPLPLPHHETATSSSSSSSSILLDDAGTEKTSITTTMTTLATNMPTESTRYMELMVYNVSHTDMVLSLNAPLSEDPPEASSMDGKFCLVRPRFSTFDHFSKKVRQVLPALGKDSLVRFPRYERSDESNRYPIKPEPMAQQHQLPIGFSLPTSCDLQVTCSELNDLRVRGRDSSRIAKYVNNKNQKAESTSLNAVFFPLIGTLMPQWQAMIQQKYNTSGQQQQQPKQVLFLVSGVGSPRNWTHSMTGNSTQVCAELMQHYLQTLYPHLIVVRVHSETNIFRYDENISFVQHELMPCIQAYRDAHAKGLPYPDEVMKTTKPSKSRLAMINAAGKTMDNLPFMDDWKKSFHVTLSFGDGSPARNHAIQAALRTYRPTYYHSWQLKTFWHESKIVDSDIEIHSFEEMETVPALSTKQLQDKPVVMQVVDEIKSFSMEMTRVLYGDDHHDIQKFWLRKTHKPVLAVLAVQLPNGRLKLYRGTNMEVSMPTGSLCAERNVIGTALADNPSLKRQDLKAIAVLSVPKPNNKHSKLQLRGRSSSIASYSSAPSLAPDPFVMSHSSLPTLTPDLDHGDDSPKLVPSYSTETLPEEGGGEGTSPTTLRDDSTNNNERRPRALSNASGSTTLVLSTPPLHPNTNGGPPAVPPAITLGPTAAMMAQPPPSPARRIPVYHGGLENNNRSKRKQKVTSKSRKRHLVVHSGDDMNPLRPCGACNEWLKKIAESNPYFNVLTFTDADCNGVYCGFIEE